MGIYHRIPALSTACLASAALALTTLAGTSCEFLEIDAQPDMLLLAANEVQMTVESASIGVLCKNGVFDLRGDNMWLISRIFLLIGLGLGATSSALAWALSTFLPPTNANWRFLSFLSSLTAVLQIPVFLLFESEPCSQHKDRQLCTLGMGSYYLIASTVFWVAVTLCTQCLDPPLWAIELEAWRVEKEEQRNSRRLSADEDIEMGDADFRITSIKASDPILTSIKASAPKVSKETKKKKRGWFFGRSEPKNDEIKVVKTESVPDDEHDNRNNNNNTNMHMDYYEGSIDSRLILRVLPDGKIPGDDGKSAASFEDLDSIVQLLEEGKLRDSSAQATKANSALRNKSLLDDDSTRLSYFKATSSPPPKERVTTRANTSSRNQPTYLKPDVSSNAGERIKIVGAGNSKEAPLSGFQILKDLETEGTAPQSDLNTSNDTDPLNASPKRATSKKDQYSGGIRNLTKKLKRDTRRRTSRRRQRTLGYAALDDDDSDHSFSYTSPPIEVKIHNMQLVGSEDVAHEITDDEQEELMDDWQALHAATTAGVRLGVQEGDGTSFGDPMGFESAGETYHSDPEPAIYSSDETKSEASISSFDKSPAKKSKDEGDSSTISSASSAGAQSQDRSSLSRGRRETRSRRRRRQHSPMGSLTDGGASLMEMSIVEETVQDIIEESSLGEEDFVSAYSLTRTISAPESRGRSFERRSSRRVRRSISQLDASPRQVRRREKGAEEPRTSTDATDSSQSVSTSSTSTIEAGNSSIAGENERTPPRSPAVSFPRKTKGNFESRSLSPDRTRRLKPMTWKPYAELSGAMHAPRPAAIEDDSSGTSNSTCSKLSRRAREFRIRRLQNKKGDINARHIRHLRQEREFTTKTADQYEDDLSDTHSEPETESEDEVSKARRIRRLRQKRRLIERESMTKTINQYEEDLSDMHTEPEHDLLLAYDSKGHSTGRSTGRYEEDLKDFLNEADDDLPVDAGSVMHSFDGSSSYVDKPVRVVSRDEMDYQGCMDALDLQLIEVSRPIGAEYGDDERSL